MVEEGTHNVGLELFLEIVFPLDLSRPVVLELGLLVEYTRKVSQVARLTGVFQKMVHHYY